MLWEDVLELSPLRLKFLDEAIDQKQTLNKISIFDAQAALIDENALKILNDEIENIKS